MRCRFIAGPILLALALTASPRATQGGLGAPFSGPLVDLGAPAPPASTLPNLAVDRTGRVWLSWLEPREGGGHRFRLSSIDPGRAGGAWSAPVTVAEGTTFMANWADFPSVFVARDGTMAAHWLEGNIGRGTYGIRLRTSKDAGRTWTPTEIPHKDPDAPVEHGFVSFFDAPGAGLGLIWLDGRRVEGRPGGMSLRSTLVSNGKAGAELVVDRRVCECCQTSAARTADGVIVAYRGKSAGSIRDTLVSRFRAGAWSAPAVVHADNWEINGCPVNGPAVTAVGNDVAVAWFMAKDSAPKVQVAFSAANGPFGPPIRLDSAVTYGRLGMVMPAADRVLVSSIERGADGPHLMIREARRDGRTGDPVAIAPMTTERSSGFARMALSGRRLVVAWTDVRPGVPARIRVSAGSLR
jgi:hypothetical protein